MNVFHLALITKGIAVMFCGSEGLPPTKANIKIVQRSIMYRMQSTDAPAPVVDSIETDHKMVMTADVGRCDVYKLKSFAIKEGVK